MPSHYLNQCWLVDNWSDGITCVETWTRIHQFSFLKGFWKFRLQVAVMLYRPRYVNSLWSVDVTRRPGTWLCHQMVTSPRYWPFVRRIHRSPVNSPHKGQWRGALIFSLICAWINGWINNGEAGDLRSHRAHYDVTVMVGSCDGW